MSNVFYGAVFDPTLAGANVVSGPNQILDAASFNPIIIPSGVCVDHVVVYVNSAITTGANVQITLVDVAGVPENNAGDIIPYSDNLITATINVHRVKATLGNYKYSLNSDQYVFFNPSINITGTIQVSIYYQTPQ